MEINNKNTQDKVLLYDRVFERKEPKIITFEEFLFQGDLFKKELAKIKGTADKELRNELKRGLLPAANLAETNILTLDIDRISDNPNLKLKLIKAAMELDYVWIIRETPSGNICLFIQYDKTLLDDVDFWRIYYKLFIDVTSKLDVNIDYLPEIDRLRYISDGKIFFEREEPILYDQYSTVDCMPYVNTNKKSPKPVIEDVENVTDGVERVVQKRGKIIFGSGRYLEDFE